MGTEITQVRCSTCEAGVAEPGLSVCLDCLAYCGDDECPVHGWSARVCGGECDLAELGGGR